MDSTRVLSGVSLFMLESLLEKLTEKKEASDRKRAELRRALQSGEVSDPITASFFLGMTAAQFFGGIALSVGISIGTGLLTRALTPAQKITRGQLEGSLQVPQSEQGIEIPEGFGADPGDGGGGGFRCGFIIPWAAPIVKHVTKTKQSTGGKGPKPAEVTNIEYSISLALMGVGNGPINHLRVYAGTDRIYDTIGSGGTGVFDPDIDPDDDYDPELPFDPNTPYTRPFDRFNGALDPDIGGSKVGIVAAGGMANLALYPGSDDQPVDPTIEAEVDTRLGAGSTPAYRGRSLAVLKAFYLTKYGGSIPPLYFIGEHQTLTTLEDIFGHWCDRAGLDSSDYDFTALSGVDVRGLLIGQRYRPADVMEQLARVFNVNLFESDKIYGTPRAGAVSVVTIDDSEIGWVSDEEESQAVDEIETGIETESNIVRRVEVKYVDPAKNFEPNLQSDLRQTTTGTRPETLELQLTMTAEEAREVAQRELYEAEVKSTSHKGTLPWTYVWLRPGDVFTVTRDEGFTEVIRLTRITPVIGAMEWEGEPVDVAVYTQPVSTWPGDVIEPPPVGIPAMSIVGFYEGPAIRTEDEGQAGFYVWAVKRVGDGDWAGAALYKIVESEPELVTTFTTQAVAGRAATALGPVSDFTAEDSTKTFTANAGTDTITSTAHGFEDGETIMVSNSGGALPAGLSSSVLYYVRDAAANTFKAALTAGGSAVDITSAGTGTHSVQRVVEVDLHDQTTTLESVTADQIENGANACLMGNEVMQVRTWELVAGYDRRWRGRNFTRGLRGSQPYALSHVAGEKFLQLDSAVKFVPQDIGELNIEREYKAVTAGQSLDDAATVEFAWTGGTLKYPPPGVEATLDETTGDWRFRVYGEETRDPEGERYHLEVVGGRDFVLRGAASRPVSLSTAGASSDSPPPPGKGSHRGADLPGNSVTAGLAYVMQLIRGERTALSATWRTTLDESDNPAGPDSTLTFAAGALVGLTMTVHAQTSAQSGSLVITDNLLGTVFTDADGEATGTRYTVEFKDGKAHFFRNRGVGSEPFYVHSFPNYEIEFPGEEGLPFPLEARANAGTDTTWAEIEVDDMGAAVVYYASEQEADGFTLPLTSITVRASQQRVVQGVVVDGQVTEVTFP